MKLRIIFAAAGLVIMLLFAGCKVTPSVHPQDLKFYSGRLSELGTLYEKFGVLHQSSGTYMDKTAQLSIRRKGDHFKPFSAKEIEKLKAAIYKELGAKFPLEIEPYTLNPERPTIAGKITAINLKNGSYLVVSSERTLGDDQMPDAKWMTPAQDALIVLHSEGKPTNASVQPQIGYKVKAWSEGLELTSYPSQTTLLVLEVTDSDPGQGDLQGVITGLDAGNPPQTPSKLEIDGKAYTLPDFAVLRIGDKKADFGQLKKGDRVQAWLPGVESMPETVTQVVVTPSS